MENPWTGLPGHEPYVLPEDLEAVGAYAGRRAVAGDPEQYGLHTELPPTPFIGDPSAPVVLLSRNPGFDVQDARDYREPEFHDAAIRNLTHEAGGLPFFAIDPRFGHTASYRWWRSMLGNLVRDTSTETVARGVFCVQAFPYHSRGLPGTIPALPSQGYANGLLARALDRGAFVVGMLARAHWEKAVPGLGSNSRVHWLRSARAGTVSSGNLDRYHALVLELRRTAR